MRATREVSVLVSVVTSPVNMAAQPITSLPPVPLGLLWDEEQWVLSPLCPHLLPQNLARLLSPASPCVTLSFVILSLHQPPTEAVLLGGGDALQPSLVTQRRIVISVIANM